jgi:O-antigen/teichoic acid export membrane protein
MQFVANFYVGGLTGLQKQLLLNLILIVCGTLRFAGAFLVLVFYSPTITAFLLWQALIMALQAILMALTLKHSLPATHRSGRFRKKILNGLWRFAAGMTGITIVTLVLMQTDKVILSRMLTLKNFGYYTLAVTIATMLIGTVAASFAHAVYPRLSQLVSTGDENALRDFYHRTCQTLAVLVFPITMIIAFFSRDILQLWLRNEDTVNHTYTLLTLIAIGSGLNGLMWLPYYLQLAHGWTKLTFYINLSAIIFLVPLMIVGIYFYGAVGGALFWAIVNGFCIVGMIHVMHKRILKGEKWKWYLYDFALPLSVAISTAGIGRLLLNVELTALGSIAALFVISLLTLFFTGLATRSTRDSFSLYWGKLLRFAQ